MEMQDRIKERRIAMGYTQEELASKLGLQKSAIAKYENGRVENIKRSIILKMAQILDCSPAYLLGWDVESEKHYTDLTNDYFMGVMRWSEDKFFSTAQTAAIRSHFSELLLRYKKLLEKYSSVNLRWKNQGNDYIKFYSGDNKTDIEIEQMFLNQNMEEEIAELSKWARSFPRIVAGNGSETINEYSAGKISDLIAAHNDFEGSDEEQGKMRKDIEKLKKLRNAQERKDN